MMAGPRLANMVSPVGAFFINCVCILLLMIFGCHNVIMHNHSTFVLGYLLLYGYDVSGRAFEMRVIGLTAGGLVWMGGFFIKIRKTDLTAGHLRIYSGNLMSGLREINGI